MNYFLLVEIAGSVLYFSQKVFLSFGKRIGWLLGFLGSIAFTIITLRKGSYSYSVLEITSGIIFIFGIFAWRKNEILQKKATFIMSGLTTVGIIVISLLNLGSPSWILENTMVILFAIGAIFLVLKRPIGWILYILGHLVLIFYGYIIGTYSIMLLQVISLPFAAVGYRNLKKLNAGKIYA
ncbi:MAG: nicotinamide mononucleotide transporter [Bdellovibrionota bacterium]